MQTKFKKFIFKFLGISLFVYLVFAIFVFGFPWVFMEPEYAFFESHKEVLKTSQRRDLIALGDSKMQAGFRPKLLNQNAYNYALGSTTPFEGYYIFKEFLQKSTTKKLIISYTPYYLMHASDVNKMSKFKFLNIKDLKDAQKIFDKLDKNNHEKISIFDYYLPSSYGKTLILGIKERRWQKFKKLKAQKYAQKGHFYAATQNVKKASQAQEETFSDFIPAKVLDFYLKNILTLAKKHDIKVYYYTMPFIQESFEKISPKFKKSYTNYINTLSKTYNFTICNEIFPMSVDNFGDGVSHLYRGAKFVTKQIETCVLDD